jgi:N-ethylmaleimide reductase
MTKSLLTPHSLGKTNLKNRVVMAPMTRSRAMDNIPNESIAEYYGQRAGAGLIISEGTSPSPNGLGYARIPGLFSKEQTKAWKKVTDSVHKNDGKIFAQLMHTGRISHAHNLPAGARVIAPSSIKAPGQMWTDREGMQDFPVPQELTATELQVTKEEFITAAINAIEAGFDGIELHAANGYLLDQFLSPHTNTRTDSYGGSIENRTRFILETVREIGEVIGGHKIGIRFSPHGLYNGMAAYDETNETYTYLATELDKLGAVYLHIFDQAAGGGTPDIPQALRRSIRDQFNNAIIYTGGYDRTKAEADINSGLADLIGFGKPFINNPDLVNRFRKNYPLNSILDFSTFYTPGTKGYTDYPVFEAEAVSA